MALATQFVTDCMIHHPNSEVLQRDLVKNPISYIDETWVAAKFTKQTSASSLFLLDRYLFFDQ